MLLRPSVAAAGCLTGSLPLETKLNARLKLIRASNRERELDVSVLRFTLGIPGFDDSELPRILGYTFGSLIVVNHIFSPEIVPPSQLRSEGLALFLSVLAVLIPSLGKLDGQSSRARNPSSNSNQVFAMADWLMENQKQELAWVSYALIRNTNTIAVIIWRGEEIVLARGCWKIPKDDIEDQSSTKVLAFLQPILRSLGGVKDTVYVSTRAATGDSGLNLFVDGLDCFFAAPFASKEGGILVASDMERAYSVKDRTWIQCLAEKLSSQL